MLGFMMYLNFVYDIMMVALVFVDILEIERWKCAFNIVILAPLPDMGCHWIHFWLTLTTF